MYCEDFCIASFRAYELFLKKNLHPNSCLAKAGRGWMRGVVFFYCEKSSSLHECNVQRCCQKRKKGAHIARTIKIFLKQFKSIIMATLTGRVTRDAKLVESNGKTFIAFDFVENDSYKKKTGEKVKMAFYFNCALWNADALLPYLVKGKILALTGNITARSYTAKNGDVKASTNVMVKNITFLGGGESAKSQEPIEQPATAGAVDDLPF
jgi:single-strand DNA-binding protein